MISDETGSVSDYSADGLLIGHLVRGVARIEEAAKNVGVSGEIVLLLEHMVLSHHSSPEYGSPKAPMFPITPRREVEATCFLMRRTTSYPASRFTPAFS